MLLLAIYIKRNKFGDLEQEFAGDTSSDSVSSNEFNVRHTSNYQRVALVMRGLLSCWVDISSPGTSKVIRVRS